MYIPAERNFLSTISDAYKVTGLPENLFTFAEELKKSQNELKVKTLQLPISGFTYEYDERKDFSYVSGDGYKISLLEASSGLQSYIPLFLVSRNLSMSINDDEKTRKKKMSVTQVLRMEKEISDVMQNKNVANFDEYQETEKIRSRYYNKCFISIVEEPEQHLFPTSQREMLINLLEFNNMNEGNKLIITTHSPYLINYLTFAIKAFIVNKKIKESNNNDKLKLELKKIVSIDSIVNPDDLIIYELNEKEGTIIKLDDYKGLPSDENYLNKKLADSNDSFANLLKIEDLCQ